MPKVQKTVTVTVDRAVNGSGVILTGLEAGYRISVHPWLVKPDESVPPEEEDDDELEKITWDFIAKNGLKFGDITLNFKTKKHFVPLQQDGSDFVLKDTLPPAANKQIVGDLDGTFPFKSQNYNYILEFTLVDDDEDKVLEIELDPGYRVKP